MKQIERDEKVRKLIETMNDAYGFVNNGASLTGIGSLKKELWAYISKLGFVSRPILSDPGTLSIHLGRFRSPGQRWIGSDTREHCTQFSDVARLTHECVEFIHDYATDTQFRSRMFRHLLSDTDATAQRFQGGFTLTKKRMVEQIIVYMGSAVIGNQSLTQVPLDESPSGHVVVVSSYLGAGKECIAGAREDVLRLIEEWVLNTADDVSRAHLVYGVAGVGKSAIAYRMARWAYDNKRLAAFYCFDTAFQTRRHPRTLFAQVSRQFRGSENPMREYAPDTETLKSVYEDVETQFEKFILIPAQNARNSKALLVVIDALDESGDAHFRHPQLPVLARRLKDLPSSFRILFTSHLEKDIADTLYKMKGAM
ncbi:hypothetical protein M422DRAFT_247506 [Sphaerobolus stellatus SS14]|nr:hypothetical protein M422DRAFT_247506 [Sphaerobolus stellatus SS14]